MYGSRSSSVSTDSYLRQLKTSADVLARCNGTSKILANILGQTDPEVAKLEDEVDSSVIALNDEYIKISKVARGIKEGEQSQRMLSNNILEAIEKTNNMEIDGLEGMKELSKVMDLNAIEARSRAGKSSSVAELGKYEKFYNSLVSVRFERAADVSSKLFNVIEKINSNQDEDEEFQVEESVIKPLCPLTSKLLEEPMLANCGHYFSKAAIESTLRQTSRMTCPSRGCQNVITINSIARDRLMDFKVRIWARKEEQERLQENEDAYVLA